MVYADQLERLIAQSEGQPIIVNEYFQWFSFDVMGQVAFSKDFNMLRGGDWHSAIKVLRDGMKIVGPVSPTPWLLNLASNVPTGSARDFNKMVWLHSREVSTSILIHKSVQALREGFDRFGIGGKCLMAFMKASGTGS